MTWLWVVLILALAAIIGLWIRRRMRINRRIAARLAEAEAWRRGDPEHRFGPRV